uniref:Uncharacterized protein n=1 Tax=Zea mays TaxID=4577 RepID=C4IYT0_MAIZE|nr:unknown [Zea mays]
MPTHILLGTLI